MGTAPGSGRCIVPFPESDQRRWLQELRDLSVRQGKKWSVVSAAPAIVEGVLDTSKGPHRYRVAWGAEYPLRPPSVWELTEGGDIVDHSVTGHAFADRSVCLYGHTPESGWKPDYTAGHAIEQLAIFLEASDRSLFPRADRVPLEVPRVRVSIHPRLISVVRGGSGWGLMAGWFRADGRLVVVTKTERTSARGLTIGGETEAPTVAWGRALGLAHQWSGLWCRVDAALGSDPPNRQRLAAWLVERVPHPEAREVILAQQFVLLVGDDATWFVWLNPPDAVREALAPGGERALYTVPVEEDIAAKLFARADARLENVAALRGAHVAVVGVGSLGGSVAVALAKAGVGRFSLFDPDVVEPENVARHVGGVVDIGTAKVDAVERAIHRVNPEAEVKAIGSALSLDPSGWNTDSMGSLREVVSAQVGLVVVATATEDAERIVNALCVAERAPAVFASVLGRADHGRVFRVLPGETPCYQCVLIAQARDPARYPRFETADVGAPDYPHPGIPGLGLDVDEVAIITARLALQTLGERIDGGIGYPAAHGDHLLWSARGGWAVDGPLQTRVERIPREPSCPVCGDEPRRELESQEAEELVLLLHSGSPAP